MDGPGGRAIMGPFLKGKVEGLNCVPVKSSIVLPTALRHFFEKSCVTCGRNDAEMGPANFYTVWRSTASIINI